MDVLLISVKEINKLMTKECQIFTFTLLLRKTDVLKYRFFNLKKNFGELQLTQIPLNFKNSCSNFKIRGLGSKTYVAFLLF